MTGSKRRPITPELARSWSDLGHLLFIEALTSSSVLRTNQFAFHGGTSLHLSWKSPRFSEDLDFLLDRTLGERMSRLIRKVEKRLQALIFAHDPELRVEIQDRTAPGDNLLNYRIVVSSPLVHGNVKVKAEFWQVDGAYLEKYETRFTYPMKEGDLVSRVTQPMPSATLEAAYADKMTAIATRRHMKWRDIFDIWWIGKQVTIRPETMARRYLHHVTAFETVDALPPREALLKFLDRDPAEIVAEADPDLKRWLPATLWSHLQGAGVEAIVAEVRGAIRRIADEVRDQAEIHQQQEAPDRGQPAYPEP
ncbi:nucleotidyl transferase AbiEii/AbiGii toxin family protein [Cereibacter sphaeroides]|uniref:nucleotidyl transferase AbiEii/AbiGii toxin family protein n=1 Tax=Cereibacter sphaeroides TaxID=1063 RepID=UPI001F44CF9E|nr:nucleotidyl transferase AbiEii/AbiGii toxin family protein [Cereibacter sphaeroides]MCE6958265.1 nucleotidyl transferase AbiEii/AbiGii toxin family protein [Cereibacter sphaeroides]MCE6971328.1 nucleotidyl transferase AbiEii/AbiGii toxin family protein [Cereibacter sphaeroides]